MVARLAVLVLTALVLAGPAHGADREARARAKAERALERVRTAEGRERTPALFELFKRRNALGADDRRRANRHFARPTDPSDVDNDGQFGAYYGGRQAERECRSGFCVHYVTGGDDAPSPADGDVDGVPDYVERVLEVFAEVREKENGALGWPQAEPDGTRGGGSQVDVYLADIGDDLIYGYVSPDRNQPDDAQLHAYQVMDEDYAEFGSTPAQRDAALRATAAHEYNHVLQLGINATLDDWIFESTATWMEEQVYPEVDDYLQYVREWAKQSTLPLTSEDLHQYGSAVWNHHLSISHGADTIRDTWTRSVPGEDSLSAYERAIPFGPEEGRFLGELTSFAGEVTEWTGSLSDYPDAEQYPDVPRAASVTVDGPPVSLTLEHASFALVGITGQGAETIVFEATFPPGLRYGVGIYGGPGFRGPGGRIGGSAGGVASGGAHTAQLIRPSSHARVTGTVVNGDRRVSGRNPDTLDFEYAYDGQPVTVRAYTLGRGGSAPPPPAQTPAPSATPTPPPPPAPTPAPASPAIDLTGPAVVIPSSNRSLRASRTGLVRFGLGPMREDVTGVISLRSDRRVRVGGRRRVLALGSARFQAPEGRRVAARIRLRRSVRRALRRLGRVRVQATLTVRDAAGNATTRTYRFTLRAPKRR